MSANKRSDRMVKVFAFLVGVMLGCYYASIRKNVFRKPKIVGSVIENKPVNETERFLVADDTTIADNLAKSIRVLCWVHSPQRSQFDSIKKTWAKRCTAFVATTNTGPNSTEIYNIHRGEHQYSNIDNAFLFIYSQFNGKYDWFIKTDGNSYVVVENLRYKLYGLDSKEPIAVGLVKNSTNVMDYLSDKAAYALSNAALKKLVDGLADEDTCTTAKQIPIDEFRIDNCLKEISVKYANSTDEHGKQLFFDQNLDDFFLPNATVVFPYPWYEQYKVNHFLDHASNYSISFYGVTPNQMYVMEFLIYQLRPYGLETKMPPLPHTNYYKLAN